MQYKQHTAYGLFFARSYRAWLQEGVSVGIHTASLDPRACADGEQRLPLECR